MRNYNKKVNSCQVLFKDLSIFSSNKETRPIIQPVPKKPEEGFLTSLQNDVIFHPFLKNLSLIPLQKDSKQPLIKWQKYQEEKMPLEEISKYAKNGCNIAIITGKISELVVFDADTEETVNFLNSFKIFQETVKVKTRKGIHYYLKISDLPSDFGCQKIYKDNIKIDLKANGGYVVAPYSCVNGHSYHILQEKNKNNIQIKKCSFKELQELIKNIKLNLGIKNENNQENKINFSELKKILLTQYKEGQRQDICLYVAGWLRKEGFSHKDIEDLITEICIEAQDNDIKQRLSVINNTFNKNDLDDIKGLSGLEELGFNKEELLNTIKTNRKFTYEYLNHNFYCKDNFIYFKEKEIFKMVGPKISLQSKVIDENNISYEINYLNNIGYLKEIKDLEKIRKLTGLAIIREQQYLEFLNYETLRCKNIKYIRKYTGWRDGVFYHPALQHQDIWENWFWHKKITKYKNEPEKQHKLIQEALEDAKSLAIVYCFCLASILNNILNTNPSVMFISGPAHVGKTTLAQLGINLFLPAEEVFISSHSTTVGFELLLKSLKDIPVLFDECNLKDYDLEKIVFMVASRIGKIRGKKDLSINISDISSNVFFTSEISEELAFKRAGAQRRFITLTIENFQDSCLSSKNIKEIQEYKKYFGAGIDLINFIQNNKDKIKNISENIKLEINKYQFNSLYHIALPLLTAVKVFELFYNKNFNLTYWGNKTIIEQQIREFEKQIDLISKFKYEFSQYIASNNNLIIDSSKPYQDKNFIGLQENNNIYILINFFTEFCKQNGFEQKILIQELIKHNILKPHSSKHIRKMKRIPSKNIVVPVYHIELNNNETEE